MRGKSTDGIITRVAEGGSEIDACNSLTRIFRDEDEAVLRAAAGAGEGEGIGMRCYSHWQSNTKLRVLTSMRMVPPKRFVSTK